MREKEQVREKEQEKERATVMGRAMGKKRERRETNRQTGQIDIHTERGDTGEETTTSFLLGRWVCFLCVGLSFAIVVIDLQSPPLIYYPSTFLPINLSISCHLLSMTVDSRAVMIILSWYSSWNVGPSRLLTPT